MSREFEGCDKCQHNGKGLKEYPCNTCIYNAIDHYKPMTNADRIRNMTDEELAEFLTNYLADEDFTKKMYGKAYHCLKWLQ